MRDTNYFACTKLKEVADRFCAVLCYLSKVGVKRFLNPTDCRCEEFSYKDTGCEFKMRIVDNPLLKYV